MFAAALSLTTTSLLSALYGLYRKHKVPTLEVVNLIVAIIVLLGIYVFKKPELLMLKPTIVGSIIVLVSVTAWLAKWGLLERLLNKQDAIPLILSRHSDLWLTVYGALIIISNEICRRYYTMDNWILYKAIFIPLLTLTLSLLFIKKYGT